MKEIISFNYYGTKLSVIHGDITLEKSQAIVNAANNELRLGGGVAGAIRKKGGPQIQEECDLYTYKYGEVATGDVVLTGSGRLKTQGIQYVLHAVGPIWHRGEQNEPSLLKTCISMPAISSGIYGFPKVLCAEILIGTTIEFIERNKNFTAKEIRFTNFDVDTVRIFKDEMEKVLKRFKDQGILIEKNEMKDVLLEDENGCCNIF